MRTCCASERERERGLACSMICACVGASGVVEVAVVAATVVVASLRMFNVASE
jgi:hypothetical protein